jgi:hypothetical protein
VTRVVTGGHEVNRAPLGWRDPPTGRRSPDALRGLRLFHERRQRLGDAVHDLRLMDPDLAIALARGLATGSLE